MKLDNLVSVLYSHFPCIDHCTLHSQIPFLILCSLFQSPVWLSLVSQEERRRAICMQFVPELGSAIVQLDTKEAKL